jgi:hypothetical protein
VLGADGKVYLSWIAREGDVLAVMRFAVLGEEGWGAPLEVMRGQDLFLNWADFPSLCALEDGRLIAHWLRAGEDPQGYDAEFSVSSDRGRTWSAPAVLHSDRKTAEHGFVSIAALDSATFGAIWLDGRQTGGMGHGGGEMALYYRPISASGELGQEVVLDSRVCDCCQTSLVAAPGGRLLAAYRDRSNSEVRDISHLVFDGQTWSEPRTIHDDGWEIAGCPVNGPRLCLLEGATAAAWFTGVGAGGGSVQVAFRRHGASAFGFPLDVDDGQPVGRVDLVTLDEESVLVSWMEFTQGNWAEWRVRRVWMDGRKEASILVGRIPSERASGFLRMVGSPSGTILTWTTDAEEHPVATVRLRVKQR